MKRIAHIYASNAKSNSGDFILGISTKSYFKEKYMNNEDCSFFDFDCRNPNFFSDQNIEELNKFDFILVGGGGLILPDTSPNNNSCWQWNIKGENYDKIKKPIYVISVGYNLFYGQSMAMPNRENNKEDLKRLEIFSKNISLLIKKAEHFSMRHNGDIENLIEIIGEDYRDKIEFEFCPSIWYVNKNWKPKMEKSGKSIAIEIKDDREWRRYLKIGRSKFYSEMESFVKYCISNKIDVSYMSHDGSKNFFKYLKSRGINIEYLDNSVANEEKIMENYSNVKTLLCSAGHSQMMAYGLGIKTISLVSHPKLRYFCEDTENENYIEINEEKNIFGKIKSLLQ